nr:hypothetical protein CFP56_63776 [Quercus suber]
MSNHNKCGRQTRRSGANNQRSNKRGVYLGFPDRPPSDPVMQPLCRHPGGRQTRFAMDSATLGSERNTWRSRDPALVGRTGEGCRSNLTYKYAPRFSSFQGHLGKDDEDPAASAESHEVWSHSSTYSTSQATSAVNENASVQRPKVQSAFRPTTVKRPSRILAHVSREPSLIECNRNDHREGQDCAASHDDIPYGLVRSDDGGRFPARGLLRFAQISAWSTALKHQ